MKISYFREFIVLSRYLNFSLAAKQLHMTQSGLSRHISALEKEVGIKLFERDTHRVRITEKGGQFLKGIQKITNDYDFLCEAVSKEGLEKITIGIPYLSIKEYLSLIITSFKSANPEVKVNYLPAYPDTIIAGLFSKQVDVAVMPRVNFLNSKDLVFHDAFDESLVLLVNRSHPLAKSAGVSLVDCMQEDFMTLKGDFGKGVVEYWNELCQRRGFAPPKKIFKYETIEEAALNVKPDSGVMLLPSHLKEVNISENSTCIDIIDKESYFTISLTHHPENHNPVTKKFISFYLEQSKIARKKK